MLPAAVRDEIVAHAREAGQVECCGLVAGRDGSATRAIRCANVSSTPAVRYRMDPREQLAAFRAMDAAGEELVAIYHSHPGSTPYPSSTDRAEAFYPEAVYILVSLRSGAPEVCAYRISAEPPGSEKQVSAVAVSVV